MSIPSTKRFRVDPEVRGSDPLPVAKRQKAARYSLRTNALEERIDRAFQQLRHQSPRRPEMEDGQNGYQMAGIDEHALMRNLIQKNPDRHRFYVLHVGANNLQWSHGLARAINADPTLPAKTRVTIIAIRGEGDRRKQVEKEGRCTLYLFSAFKIERLLLEFQKRGLHLNDRIDLILSRGCFRHLVEPVGTFAQIFSLLRLQAMLLIDGFFFLDKKGSPESGGFNDRMTRLCLATKARVLTQHFARDGSLNHFVLQRIDPAPLRLPMHYVGMKTPDPKYQIASKCMTRFDMRPPFPQEPLNMPEPNPILWNPIINGDKELFRFLKAEALFISPAVCHHPLMGEDDTPLHKAIEQDDQERVKTLLEQGADIDERDGEGDTPLHIAIEKRNRILFDMLLERGARTDLQDRSGYYALHIAARIDDPYFIHMLLVRGADPKLGQKGVGDTPLAEALERDHHRAALLLTPQAHRSALEGDCEAIRSFLEAGWICIDAKDAAKRSLISIAVQTGNIQLIHLLISYGADLEKSSQHNSSILFEVLAQEDPEMLEIFLQAGADPDTMEYGNVGDRLLFKAIEKDNREILELLIQHGANVYAKNWNGEEALPMAEKQNKPHAIELIRAKIATLLHDALHSIT